MTNINTSAVWTSLFIGIPTGLISLFFVLCLPGLITGEGLALFGIIGLYGNAILGLLAAYLIALIIAGHLAARDLEKDRGLLLCSFRYSLTINIIIWPVFVVVGILSNAKEDMLFFFIVPALILFVLCSSIATFTMSLLICSFISQNVRPKV